MDENINLESVEAALALPQNQQAGASSLAPQSASAETQGAGGVSSLAPTADPLASLAPKRGGDAADMLRRAAIDGASQPSPTQGQSGGAYQRLVTSLRGASAAPTDEAAPVQQLPVQPVQPVPLVPRITEAPSAFGRGAARGYDYGGVRVELPTGFNLSDPKAARDYMNVSNQIIDWINEDEEV